MKLLQYGRFYKSLNSFTRSAYELEICINNHHHHNGFCLHCIQRTPQTHNYCTLSSSDTRRRQDQQFLTIIPSSCYNLHSSHANFLSSCVSKTVLPLYNVGVGGPSFSTDALVPCINNGIQYSNTTTNKRRGFKRLLAFAGFCAGIIFGGSLKLAYNSGKFSFLFREDAEDEDNSNYCIYDSQTSDTILPFVSASKGFTRPLSEEETREKDSNASDYFKFGKTGGAGGGKGPPNYKDKFNFLADVVECLSPSVVYVEIVDVRR